MEINVLCAETIRSEQSQDDNVVLVISHLQIPVLIFEPLFFAVPGHGTSPQPFMKALANWYDAPLRFSKLGGGIFIVHF